MKFLLNNIIVYTFLLFSLLGDATAYTLFTCSGGVNNGVNPKWSNPNQTWRLNTSQWGAAQRSAMQQAAGRLSSIRGSSINTITTNAALGNPEPAYGNGFNDVVIDTAGTYLPPGTGATATVAMSAVRDCSNLNSNGTFIEVDIAYRSGPAWTGNPDNNPYVGSLFAHELGHGVGVGHEDTAVLAQMNASVGGVLGGPSPTEQGSPAFHGQDAAAIRQIYPDSTTGVNGYVSKFRRGPGPFGTVNNLTSRQANRLRTQNGTNVGLNGGLITSGQTYRLQYTAGNTGTAARNIRVDMRISSPNNQNIHFGNTVVATRTHFLQAGQSVESEINFTMPVVTTGSNYYFGYTVRPPGDNDAADDRTLIRGRYRGM